MTKNLITISGMKRLMAITLLLILAAPAQLSARTAQETEAALINTAGMQRMLSQRITKAYLYLGMEIRMGKSQRQMKGSVNLLLNNHEVLKKSIGDNEALGILADLDPKMDSFQKLTTSAFTVRNASDMLKLSDEILLLSQKLVTRLEGIAKEKTAHLVNISGRQRMLSQRIAKLYIAYQAGFQDASILEELKKAIELYDASHKELAAASINTDEINRELASVQNLWKSIRLYFNEVEKGGFGVTVFVTTDAIMRRMNTITGLYVQEQWKISG